MSRPIFAIRFMAGRPTSFGSINCLLSELCLADHPLEFSIFTTSDKICYQTD